jgi:toxin-antitoxin system PIN domain toxin
MSKIKPRFQIDLPDVNVLVALFDPAHVFHALAHNWFAEARQRAWATCPLTQSGFLRVVTNPTYPNRHMTIVEAALHLRQLIDNHAETHYFLNDETSLLDASRFDLSRLSGYRQVTDLHLLGICSRFQARLVTFDRGVVNLTDAITEPIEILLLAP